MRYATILIGLSLLYAAWHLHTKAVAMTDEALQVPYTVDNPCPPGMEDQFFRTSSRELLETPKTQAELANARRVEQMALLAAVAGIALVYATILRRNRVQITPAPQQPTPTTKEVTS